MTPRHRYPYGLVRLIQVFTVPGIAPDMIACAKDGFDFGKDWEDHLLNFHGGHGVTLLRHSTLGRRQ